MYYNEKTGNFAIVQPNIIEYNVNEETYEMVETIIGPNPDYILIEDKPSEDYIYDGSKWIQKPPVVLTLEQAKTAKLSDVTAEYNSSVVALVGNTDQYKLASWTKQEAEARAYIADNTVETPLLSGMVLARGLGETILEFANKIISNADAYKTAYASILGTYQAKQKAINAATTVSEVQAI
jgi:Icc-related predicted phosphoesterase